MRGTLQIEEVYQAHGTGAGEDQSVRLKGWNTCGTQWIEEGYQAHGTGARGDHFAMPKGQRMVGLGRNMTCVVEVQLGQTPRNGHWRYSRLQDGNACDTFNVGTCDPPLRQYILDSGTVLLPVDLPL